MRLSWTLGIMMWLSIRWKPLTPQLHAHKSGILKIYSPEKVVEDQMQDK